MSTLLAPNLGALLRRDRRAARLTQQELAALAGVSVDAISLMERGVTRAPHRDTLDLLANALRLGPGELAEWQLAARRARVPGAGEVLAAPAPADSGALPSAWLPQEDNRNGPPGEPLASRSQLPIPATSLIGREEEVRVLRALLQRPEVRLLTITGTAGVGKTRLALQVAAETVDMFAQGVHFVSLDALANADLVLSTVADVLGLREPGDVPVISPLARALREQKTLLVLDNFEQVIAAAPHLAALIEECPTVKLLVTSREVLRIRAEQRFVLSPLPLPVLPLRALRAPLAPIERSALEELESNPAVQLFLQRARSVQPDFRLTPTNAASIAAICRRLEGIPLALELAAPYVKLLSPQALSVRLEGRLRFLTNGERDLSERQRSMRATVAWSYNLLSPTERALFRRMSVFAGGWTLDAMEQVCLGAGAVELGDLDVLDGLRSLLDKSLVGRERGQGSEGEARFSMLYALREFGLEQLEAEGEGPATREAHALYYLALVEEACAQPGVAGSRSQLQVQHRLDLELEHDNLRTALDWWLQRAEKEDAPAPAELALRLWWSLSQWRFSRSCYRDGYADVKRVLGVRARMAEPMQVKALLYAATVLHSVDEQEQAEALAQEAMALARQIGDLPDIAFALRRLGVDADL